MWNRETIICRAIAVRRSAQELSISRGRRFVKRRARSRVDRVVCGRGAWVVGSTTWDLTRPPGAPRGAPQPQPVAASGAWISGDTYEMKLVFYTTPFCFTWTCRFGRDKLGLKPKVNVSFGRTEFPQLTGRSIDA